jgi:hypothetical protein
MLHRNQLSALSDDELLRRLSLLLSQSRRAEADLIAHIAEVDHRRLYLGQACSSMFTYCIEVLRLSEPEAYLRIAVGRTARRFPVILTMLGDGRLHLSGVALLSSHLTEENAEEVLGKAAHRTKRQIEELIAELAPKPDAPATIRKLPSPPLPVQSELRPDKVPVSEPVMPVRATSSVVPPPPAPVVRSLPPRPEPLSPARFKITFTAGSELKEKLERLQALTKEDLAAAIEAAVTEKLERLEAKRFGDAKKPRKSLAETNTSPRSRYVPAAVRRFVWRRDGNRCAFVDEHGRRCTERKGLEFHHQHPFGLGGDHDPARIHLMCRRHNLHLAERDYGKEMMERYRNQGGRVSETAPMYGFAGPWDAVDSSMFDADREIRNTQTQPFQPESWPMEVNRILETTH